MQGRRYRQTIPADDDFAADDNFGAGETSLIDFDKTTAGCRSSDVAPKTRPTTGDGVTKVGRRRPVLKTSANR